MFFILCYPEVCQHFIISEWLTGFPHVGVAWGGYYTCRCSSLVQDGRGSLFRQYQKWSYERAEVCHPAWSRQRMQDGSSPPPIVSPLIYWPCFWCQFGARDWMHGVRRFEVFALYKCNILLIHAIFSCVLAGVGNSWRLVDLLVGFTLISFWQVWWTVFWYDGIFWALSNNCNPLVWRSFDFFF